MATFQQNIDRILKNIVAGKAYEDMGHIAGHLMPGQNHYDVVDRTVAAQGPNDIAELSEMDKAAFYYAVESLKDPDTGIYNFDTNRQEFTAAFAGFSPEFINLVRDSFAKIQERINNEKRGYAEPGRHPIPLTFGGNTGSRKTIAAGLNKKEAWGFLTNIVDHVFPDGHPAPAAHPDAIQPLYDLISGFHDGGVANKAAINATFAAGTPLKIAINQAANDVRKNVRTSGGRADSQFRAAAAMIVKASIAATRSQGANANNTHALGDYDINTAIKQVFDYSIAHGRTAAQASKDVVFGLSYYGINAATIEARMNAIQAGADAGAVQVNNLRRVDLGAGPDVIARADVQRALREADEHLNIRNDIGQDQDAVNAVFAEETDLTPLNADTRTLVQRSLRQAVTDSRAGGIQVRRGRFGGRGVQINVASDEERRVTEIYDTFDQAIEGAVSSISNVNLRAQALQFIAANGSKGNAQVVGDPAIEGLSFGQNRKIKAAANKIKDIYNSQIEVNGSKIKLFEKPVVKTILDGIIDNRISVVDEIDRAKDEMYQASKTLATANKNKVTREARAKINELTISKLESEAQADFLKEEGQATSFSAAKKGFTRPLMIGGGLIFAGLSVLAVIGAMALFPPLAPFMVPALQAAAPFIGPAIATIAATSIAVGVIDAGRMGVFANTASKENRKARKADNDIQRQEGRIAAVKDMDESVSRNKDQYKQLEGMIKSHRKTKGDEFEFANETFEENRKFKEVCSYNLPKNARKFADLAKFSGDRGRGDAARSFKERVVQAAKEDFARDI